MMLLARHSSTVVVPSLIFNSWANGILVTLTLTLSLTLTVALTLPPTLTLISLPSPITSHHAVTFITLCPNVSLPNPTRYEKKYDSRNEGTPSYLVDTDGLGQSSKDRFEIWTILCSTQ